MKRTLLLFCLILTVLAGSGQSPRNLVLLEEFTSTTCGPCAGVNPTFHTWQVQNPDKFTSIYYHVNWPAPGDPMNLANPQENGARVSYYGVNYVPFSVLDGNYHNGSASGWNMTTVTNRLAMPSPFEVQMQHIISPGQDSVYSNMLIKCTQDITGNLVAHNVIIEKWIHFNTAPGSNGEKDFYNVMKKMLPGSNGTQLPSSMQTGDYILLEGAWKFGTVYDKTQIASVGFVQDKSSKEVHQTANSTTTPLVLPYGTDLQVLEILNVPAKTCINKITPMVKIRNNGNNTITSMTLKYKVNDGDLVSHTWTGSLASMQKTVISLPEYSFNILASNELVVYSTSPNTLADEYPKNDTLHYPIMPSPVSTDQVKIILRTDNAPQEITWDIRNSLDVAIANGGPYTTAGQVNQHTVTLPQADCYTFTIYDAGGNGICCSNGTGVYEVSSNGVIFKQGGQFAYSESTEFWLEAPVTVSEPAHAHEIMISPNPFKETARLSFYVGNSNPVSVRILNVFGQVTKTVDLGIMPTGNHEITLNGHDLAPGLYVIQVDNGTGVLSRKVTVIR